jgi:hypothetical protein
MFTGGSHRVVYIIQLWYHNQTLFDMGAYAYTFMAIFMFAY